MGRRVRFLLDTHALFWWWTDRKRLSADVLALIGDDTNIIVVSAVSTWEIATKHRLGKLSQLDDVQISISELFTRSIQQDRFDTLAITHDHGLRGGDYDLPHRDPFDRLLAAQSEIENIPLITRDPAFAAFPCETRW